MNVNVKCKLFRWTRANRMYVLYGRRCGTVYSFRNSKSWQFVSQTFSNENGFSSEAKNSNTDVILWKWMVRKCLNISRTKCVCNDGDTEYKQLCMPFTVVKTLFQSIRRVKNLVINICRFKHLYTHNITHYFHLIAVTQIQSRTLPK